jgi:FkbM family methyltransferase
MNRFDSSKYLGLPLGEVLGLASKSVESGTEALKEAQNIFRLCLEQNIPLHLKGDIRGKLWTVEKQLGFHTRYFSQSGQDRFIYENIFKTRKNGTFVEIGGYNGWQGSNCLFFEKMRNWKGLIVEASPSFVGLIAEIRNCEVIHAAISDHDGTVEFMDVTSGFTQMSGIVNHIDPEQLNVTRENPKHKERIVQVPSMRLSTLLRKYDLREIDYCSIDVEGAERAILDCFDFDEFNISVFSLENQTGNSSGSYEDIMEPAGYRLLSVVGLDEIWVK